MKACILKYLDFIHLGQVIDFGYREFQRWLNTFFQFQLALPEGDTRFFFVYIHAFNKIWHFSTIPQHA